MILNRRNILGCLALMIAVLSMSMILMNMTTRLQTANLSQLSLSLMTLDPMGAARTMNMLFLLFLLLINLSAFFITCDCLGKNVDHSHREEHSSRKSIQKRNKEGKSLKEFGFVRKKSKGQSYGQSY